MRIVVLGSGTSHGIPVVGCGCGVCASRYRRNMRTRASILIEVPGKKGDTVSLLVDTATEFRLQAVREKIDSLDAVLLTHAHADHIHGLDDIRPLTMKKPIPVYGNAETIDEVRERFRYIFHPKQKGGGVPQIELFEVGGKDSAEFEPAGIPVTAVPIKHGCLDILGYRVGNFAYLTDCSRIPDTSRPLLEGLEVLILGALRYREHETHFNIAQALQEIERIRPRRAYLTHFCHDIDHRTIKKELPLGVAPSYDGLEIMMDG